MWVYTFIYFKKCIFEIHILIAFVLELRQEMSFRYGENLLNLEAIALESIQDCIQNIQNYNNKPFDPKKHIYFLTADIMAQLVSKREKI